MKKILYIDDDKNACMLAKVYMEKYHFYFIYTHDTENARAELRKNNFDLIICDIGLPKEDGMEFYHWLHSEDNYKNIPFLFVSAHAMGFDKLLVEHKDIFIQKPIFFPDLINRINKLLLDN